MNKQIVEYIRKYDNNSPILTDDIYQLFPDVQKGSIRQLLKRLCDKGEIDRVKPGLYYKPKPNRVITLNNLSSNSIIKKKYLGSNAEVYGYKSGMNFANQIGLTTQTASVDTIVSNNVSNKKRRININNSKIIINSPRVTITNMNYKLLQVLDLMNNFENYCEESLEQATPKIINYLFDLKLNVDEIKRCIEAYPLIAQVKFYGSGVFYELITR
jgi:predicted transcriptional regulator of viral defense system